MKTGRIYKDPYSDKEIEVLVEDYEELSGLRSKAWIQVRLMDIDKAWEALPPTEKEAVLLVGFMGLRLQTAAKLVDQKLSTMWHRYTRGLRYLASYLNGGR